MTAWTITIENTLFTAITNLDTVMAGTGADRRTIAAQDQVEGIRN